MTSTECAPWRPGGCALNLAILLVLGGWNCTAHAGELAFGTGYAFKYETNPSHVSANPVSDYSHEVIAGLSYRESSASVNARLLVQAEARDYHRNTFPADTFVYVDGAAIWSIMPKTLDWTLEDIRRESRIDLTAVDTPANRAITNTFSTGPDLTLRITGRTALGIGARYGRVDVDNQLGSRRSTGYARLENSLSETSKLSANYQSTRIRAEPRSASGEARREDVFARYDSRTSPLNHHDVEVGATRVTSGGEEFPTRTRLRLSMTRQLSSSIGVRAALYDSLSDTYTDSLASRDAIAVAPPATNEVYRAKGAAAALIFGGTRSSLEIRAAAQRIDYEGFGKDYDEDSATVRYHWQQAADFRINANLAYAKRQFQDLGTENVESSGGVGLAYQVSRTIRMTAAAGYERIERAPAAQPITNRVVSIFIAYSNDPFYVPQSKR